MTQPGSAAATGGVREVTKSAARGLFTILVVPHLLSYWIRSGFLGPDRALEGSSQSLSLVPGIVGQYMRRAFLGHVLAACHHTVTVEFGTLFSQSGARLGRNVYIGPHCHLGLVSIGDDALLGPSVHIPSGHATHGIADAAVPIREQPGRRDLVRIGAGTWIGSNAVVMADVGSHCVIGAGAVVTTTVPDSVIAAGVPAKVIRSRVPSSPGSAS